MPGDDEAAIGERGNVRQGLSPGRQAVDLKLRPDRLAAGIEALSIDAVSVGAVLAVGGPHNHVAAVCQHRDLRFVLGAGGVGVDPFAEVHLWHTVEFLDDVDGDAGWRTGAAITIADPDADHARCSRALRGAGVGEVLDQILHRIDGGVGIQSNDKAAAIASAAQRADRSPAEGDGATAQANLPRSRALVAHRQLVGSFAALNVKKFDTTASKVGGIEIGQADRGIDDLRGGIDQILGEGHGAGEVAEFGIALAGEIGQIAEDLLANLVGVVAAVGN